MPGPTRSNAQPNRACPESVAFLVAFLSGVCISPGGTWSASEEGRRSCLASFEALPRVCFHVCFLVGSGAGALRGQFDLAANGFCIHRGDKQLIPPWFCCPFLSRRTSTARRSDRFEGLGHFSPRFSLALALSICPRHAGGRHGLAVCSNRNESLS